MRELADFWECWGGDGHQGVMGRAWRSWWWCALGAIALGAGSGEAVSSPAGGLLYGCDEPVPDVLVLFDRSSSIDAWGNRWEARAHLLEIRRRQQPEQQVTVLGAPAVDAVRPCDVSGPASVADALGWQTAGGDARTPLAQAVDAAVEWLKQRDHERPVSIVAITDGYQDCDGFVGHTADALEALIRERVAAHARIGAVEVLIVGERRPTKQEAAATLARVFAPVAAEAPRLVFDWFPDVVAVGTREGWHCSGVLLGDRPYAPRLRGRVVLTAKHCLPADRVAVSGAVTKTATTVGVERAVAHPDPAVDVAVLVLPTTVAVPTHVSRREGDRAEPSGVIRVVGFGADDPRGEHGAGDLHMTELPVSGWGCRSRAADELGCRPDVEMAIRGSGGRDSCRGDSGAPAFERLTCGWRLVGVASRAVASARRRCGDGGIYSRIDAIDGWLTEQLRIVSEEGK